MKHVQQNPHNYLKRFGDLRPHLSKSENSDFSISQTLVAQHLRVLACPLALGLERVQLPETMFAHQNLLTILQFYRFTVLQFDNFTIWLSNLFYRLCIKSCGLYTVSSLNTVLKSYSLIIQTCYTACLAKQF